MIVCHFSRALLYVVYRNNVYLLGLIVTRLCLLEDEPCPLIWYVIMSQITLLGFWSAVICIGVYSLA